MPTVAVLADSHGEMPIDLLRYLRDNKPDAIVHAGDFVYQDPRKVKKEETRDKMLKCAADILAELKKIRPTATHAVCGNTDVHAGNPAKLPETILLDQPPFGPVRFAVHHGHVLPKVAGKNDDCSDLLKKLADKVGVQSWQAGDIIVCGHSHTQHHFVDEESGVLFLNPGATFSTRRARNPETPHQAALVHWPEEHSPNNIAVHRLWWPKNGGNVEKQPWQPWPPEEPVAAAATSRGVGSKRARSETATRDEVVVEARER
jgi:putative phosphoesterase